MPEELHWVVCSTFFLILQIIFIPFPPRYIPDHFYARNSLDSIINNYGRELIDMCIASDLRIVNGRVGHDNSGMFTCLTPQGNSVVDYTIGSEDMFNIISDFEVGRPSHYSDHCPLTLHLKKKIHHTLTTI